MNPAGCTYLLRGPHSGTWYRAVQLRYAAASLVTAHTKVRATRFNEGRTALPPFEILYLAEDPMVALHETGGMLGYPLSLPGQPAVTVAHPRIALGTVSIRVVLSRVADLTRTSQQSLVGTTAQELTGDWFANGIRTPVDSVSQPVGTAPTQELGQALFGTPHLEGFRSISAKYPTKQILAVFPEKLLPGSSLEFVDPNTGYVIDRIDPRP